MKFFLALLFCAANCWAEPLTDWRIWTSLQGTETKARLLSLRASTGRTSDTSIPITLELRNGKKLSLGTHQLINEDHKLVYSLSQTKGGGPGASIKIAENKTHELDISMVFLAPDGWVDNRSRIPNRGTYEDNSEDFQRAFANHLFWFWSNGAADFGTSKDRDRIWKKALAQSERHIKGPSRDAHIKMAAALKEVESPVKQVTSQKFLRFDLDTLKKCVGGTSFVTIEGMGFAGERRRYAYSLPVLEVKGDKLVIAYREDRVEVGLEVVTEGKSFEKGTWLRIDPANQSWFAKQLRED
ncbi:MAG: hypothetical protein ACSHYB_02000 [Roseibacillus sp.]